MHADQRDLDFAVGVAHSAGEIVMRYYRTGFDVEMKHYADPVTIADRESETLIRQAIQHEYPDDGIDGEEQGLLAGRSGRVWIIDPLDGTANYTASLPLFAVVLTLVDERDLGNALLNVTLDPFHGELFQALQGNGATLNGQPIRASQGNSLAQAVVNVHFTRRSPFREASFEIIDRITLVSPQARSLGSSALAQAYVACGRIDGHAMARCARFDVIGGNLLVTEAGGVVTDLFGRPWKHPGGLLAAGAWLHPMLLEHTRTLQRQIH